MAITRIISPSITGLTIPNTSINNASLNSVTALPSAVAVTNTPAFMARRSSNQSCANGADTIVIFDSELFDTDSAYDTSTGKFTVPSGKGGKYFISTKIRTSETADWNSNEIYILVNGSIQSYAGAWFVNDNYGTLSTQITIDLSAGDYVQIAYYQGSGSSRNISTQCTFNGYKLIT